MTRTFLIDAVGNLVLFALVFYWLGLPVASAGNLAWAAILGLMIIALAAYLVAFGFNRDSRAATGKVPVMLIWLLLVGLVLAALTPVWNWAPSIGNWLGSALTFGTRTPVKPEWVTTLYRWVVGLAGGLVVAGIFLPAAARAAEKGSSGLSDWRPIFSGGYLVTALIYAFAGLWLPWTLFWWIPAIASFEGQMTSFVLRVGLAFAIYVGAWLIFARYCRTQAVSPER